MIFQNIRKIETADFYVDLAFRRAKERAAKEKGKKWKKKRLEKYISIERERFKTVSITLTKELELVLKSFPSLDNLPKFYLELVKCTINYEYLKKSLGALNWAAKRLKSLTNIYLKKLRNLKNFNLLSLCRREFYGRVSSVVKQINKNLEFLEGARRIMRNFPIVDACPTIVIAGYPNTGKTTLLKSLTGSEPKIAPYPFTTQKLMLGYSMLKGKRLQLIDTPGLLDRPLSKRNKIEMQAILALRHFANLILFVVDASETCGYGIEEQLKLLKEIKVSFKIPVIVVINKIDIGKMDIKINDAIKISAEKNVGIEQIIEKIGCFL